MSDSNQQSQLPSYTCPVNGDHCIGPDCPYEFRHEIVYPEPKEQLAPRPTTHYDGTPCTIIPCSLCGDDECCDCDVPVCETCSKRFCHECCGTDPDNGCTYCDTCSVQFLNDVIAGLYDDETTMTPDEARKELAARGVK